MKVLERYLFRQLLGTSVLTVAVLTMLLVAGNVFTRLFDLLVNHDVPLAFIAEAVLLLIPFSMAFTLPWGLLTATLLVLGRMSADSELVAVRAGGIGLRTFVAPALLLALIASGLSLWINCDLAPAAQDRMKASLVNLATRHPSALFGEDAVIDVFPDKRIYVEHKDGTKLNSIHVWELNEQGRPVRSFRSAHGSIGLAHAEDDPARPVIRLNLMDARMEERDPEKPGDLALIQGGRRFETFPLDIPLDRLIERTNKRKGLSAQPLNGLLAEVLAPDAKRAGYNFTPTLTEIQKRIAISMASLTLVLAAIPLAIRSHRRETFAGLLLSLAVISVYYTLFVLGETFKARTALVPEAIVWLPNALFQVAGGIALLRLGRAS
jgi:lipopolysaccharide export system permease protein